MAKGKSSAPPKTRRFGGKTYHLAKEHNLTKPQAQKTAEAFRKYSKGHVKARVSKSGGKYHVYTREE